MAEDLHDCIERVDLERVMYTRCRYKELCVGSQGYWGPLFHLLSSSNTKLWRETTTSRGVGTVLKKESGTERPRTRNAYSGLHDEGRIRPLLSEDHGDPPGLVACGQPGCRCLASHAGWWHQDARQDGRCADRSVGFWFSFWSCEVARPLRQSMWWWIPFECYFGATPLLENRH